MLFFTRSTSVFACSPLGDENAITRSGLCSSSICWFRIGPAAFPCLSQSAGQAMTWKPSSYASSSASESAPLAAPWMMTESGGSFSISVRIGP